MMTLPSKAAIIILPALASVKAANNTSQRKRRASEVKVYSDLSPTSSAINTAQKATRTAAKKAPGIRLSAVTATQSSALDAAQRRWALRQSGRGHDQRSRRR